MGGELSNAAGHRLDLSNMDYDDLVSVETLSFLAKVLLASCLVAFGPALILEYVPTKRVEVSDLNDAASPAGRMQRILLAFAGGGLMAEAALHLLPHLFAHDHGHDDHGDHGPAPIDTFTLIAVGFLVTFAIDRFTGRKPSDSGVAGAGAGGEEAGGSTKEVGVDAAASKEKGAEKDGGVGETPEKPTRAPFADAVLPPAPTAAAGTEATDNDNDNDDVVAESSEASPEASTDAPAVAAAAREGPAPDEGTEEAVDASEGAGKADDVGGSPDAPDPPAESSSEPKSVEPGSADPSSVGTGSVEPAPVEPTADEPASDEAAVSAEPASDEPASEEPASEEPESDEPASDEPVSDEPTSDESKIPKPAPAEPELTLYGNPKTPLEAEAPVTDDKSSEIARDAGVAGGTKGDAAKEGHKQAKGGDAPREADGHGHDHGHDHDDHHGDPEGGAYATLAVDVLHNIIDGMGIGAAYTVGGVMTGHITAVLKLIHELQHEVGDVATLVQHGMGKHHAIHIQHTTAAGVFLGVAMSLGAGVFPSGLLSVLLALSAGATFHLASGTILGPVLAIPAGVGGSSHAFMELLAFVTGAGGVVAIGFAERLAGLAH